MSRLRRYDTLEMLEAENRDYESIVLSKSGGWRVVGKRCGGLRALRNPTQQILVIAHVIAFPLRVFLYCPTDPFLLTDQAANPICGFVSPRVVMQCKSETGAAPRCAQPAWYKAYFDAMVEPDRSQALLEIERARHAIENRAIELAKLPRAARVRRKIWFTH